VRVPPRGAAKVDVFNGFFDRPAPAPRREGDRTGGGGGGAEKEKGGSDQAEERAQPTRQQEAESDVLSYEDLKQQELLRQKEVARIAHAQEYEEEEAEMRELAQAQAASVSFSASSSLSSCLSSSSASLFCSSSSSSLSSSSSSLSSCSSPSLGHSSSSPQHQQQQQEEEEKEKEETPIVPLSMPLSRQQVLDSLAPRNHWFIKYLSRAQRAALEEWCLIVNSRCYQLQPHQLHSLVALVSPVARRRGLIADHCTGSGKTLLALSVIYVLLRVATMPLGPRYHDAGEEPSPTNVVQRVLFIAPKSLLLNAPKEMDKYHFPHWMRARVWIVTPQSFYADYRHVHLSRLRKYGVVAKADEKKNKTKRRNHCQRSYFFCTSVLPHLAPFLPFFFRPARSSAAMRVLILRLILWYAWTVIAATTTMRSPMKSARTMVTIKAGGGGRSDRAPHTPTLPPSGRFDA
jgi:hypothetical protein